MDRKALAIANNDIVYLWWTYPKKIPDCLGFTIRRMQKGKAAVALPAFVGFKPLKKGEKPPVPHPTTDYWPIQSYQWKDLFVPEETEVWYEIVPVKGLPGQRLKEIPGLAVRTNRIQATDTIDRHRVVFNRGIIATQSLSKKLPKGKTGSPSAAALRKHIGTPGDKIRDGLAGEAIVALTSLLERAQKEKGTCYAAMYELTDPELIAAIQKSKGRIELILANADSSKQDSDGKTRKVYDGTNAATRKALHAVLGDALHDRLLPSGSYIGHNKFVVYVDKAGAPKAVLTGSTNWTSTGLCAQTNNILLIEDRDIAARYLDYWHRLIADQAQQGPALRQTNAVTPPALRLDRTAGKARVWFSPNTQRKTKPAKNPAAPPDMAEVFEAIDSARQGVLFLLFSAGTPSILDRLTEVSEQRAKAGKPFFVRGAISDAKAASQFATRVYNDSLLKAPNKLITGIGGVPDQYSYWEKELAKLGHAVIHDKVLVVDPFSDRCIVFTGSHNLGYKASYSNDENLCIIRGNRAIAQAYTTHVLDIVNHYNWRNKLSEKKKQDENYKQAYYDLDETDQWQNKYFSGNFLKSRDQFFFP
jgi:phosphatidylserine/phosphatidylglycerophosphate/cardiolipin synthase-like enzyme